MKNVQSCSTRCCGRHGFNWGPRPRIFGGAAMRARRIVPLNLSQLIDLSGIPRAQIVRQSGITSATLENWARGRHRPSPSCARLVRRVLLASRHSRYLSGLLLASTALISPAHADQISSDVQASVFQGALVGGADTLGTTVIPMPQGGTSSISIGLTGYDQVAVQFTTSGVVGGAVLPVLNTVPLPELGPTDASAVIPLSFSPTLAVNVAVSCTTGCPSGLENFDTNIPGWQSGDGLDVWDPAHQLEVTLVNGAIALNVGADALSVLGGAGALEISGNVAIQGDIFDNGPGTYSNAFGGCPGFVEPCTVAVTGSSPDLTLVGAPAPQIGSTALNYLAIGITLAGWFGIRRLFPQKFGREA